MCPGITTKPKQNKRYFYFRCDNDECTRKPRSIRAKVLLDAIKVFLARKPFSSRAAYDHYAKEMELVSEERVRQAGTNLLTLRLEKSKLENRLARAKNLLYDEKDERVQKDTQQDIARLKEQIETAETSIAKIEKEVAAGKVAILTYEEFLELMEKLPKTLASKETMADLDYVIRKVFSNFTVRGKNLETITLSAPFDALCDQKVASSGHGGTRTLNPFGIRF